MKYEKGQAVVEFALILPIFLLLICGIVDFGRLLYIKNNLNLVSQEAVRYASFEHTKTDINTYTKSEANGLGVTTLTDSDITIIVNSVDPGSNGTIGKAGQNVTITIVKNFTYITPIINGILPAPTITTKSTIRIE